MNLFCTPRLVVVALSVLILAGCGGGGAGGGDRRLAPPEYDLTGHWKIVEPVTCTTISTVLSANEAEELKSFLESELLGASESRVVQMGNDLEFIDLGSGRRVDGTLSGDQIQATYSEQLMLGGFEIDIYGETEGTVLNADRLALTEEVNITLELEGVMVAAGAICSYHAVRTM